MNLSALSNPLGYLQRMLFGASGSARPQSGGSGGEGPAQRPAQSAGYSAGNPPGGYSNRGDAQSRQSQGGTQPSGSRAGPGVYGGPGSSFGGNTYSGQNRGGQGGTYRVDPNGRVSSGPGLDWTSFGSRTGGGQNRNDTGRRDYQGQRDDRDPRDFRDPCDYERAPADDFGESVGARGKSPLSGLFSLFQNKGGEAREGEGGGLLNDLLGKLNISRDTLLIGLLIYLLSREGGDQKIILALIYLLL